MRKALIVLFLLTLPVFATCVDSCVDALSGETKYYTSSSGDVSHSQTFCLTHHVSECCVDAAEDPDSGFLRCVQSEEGNYYYNLGDGYCIDPGFNGEPCVVGISTGVAENPCSGVTGVWDDSENQCVVCDSTSHTETEICGDTSNLYISADASGLAYCTGSGDDLCESACGASAECDELAPGTCLAQGQCSSTCQYVDYDSSESACENCGYHWAVGGEISASSCCGDDAGEYYKSCDGATEVCDASTDDEACCDSASDCVYNGECISEGNTIEVGGTTYVCQSGKWVLGITAPPYVDENTCACSCEAVDQSDPEASTNNCHCIYYDGSCYKDPDSQCACSCPSGYVGSGVSCSCGCALSGGTCYAKASCSGTCYDYECQGPSGSCTCACGTNWVSNGVSCSCGCKDTGCDTTGNGCEATETCSGSCTCNKKFVVDTNGNNDLDSADTCTYDLDTDWLGTSCERVAYSGNWDGSWDGIVKYKVCDADACTSNNADLGCCASDECVYSGSCYASGEVEDVDGDGYWEYCNSGTWTKVPDGGSCRYGVECASGLCVDGTCSGTCTNKKPCSDGDFQYSGVQKICWDANGDGSTECAPAVVLSDNPQAAQTFEQEGNNVCNSYFDASDPITLKTSIKTKTESLSNINVRAHLRDKTNDTLINGGIVFANGVNIDTSGATYSATVDLSSYTQNHSIYFHTWIRNDDHPAFPNEYCCYNIGTSGEHRAEFGCITKADEINLTCSISCSNNELLVSFTPWHENKNNGNNIYVKACYGELQCKSASEDYCETSATGISPETSSSCSISAEVEEGKEVYAYARDVNLPYIDTDSPVICGTIPDLDTSSCWCAAGGKVWTGTKCCEDNTDNYLENNWACDNGTAFYCNSTNTCVGVDLDDNGINELFCNGSAWVSLYEVAEVCEGACEALGGKFASFFIIGTPNCCGNQEGESVAEILNLTQANVWQGSYACCAPDECAINDGASVSCVSEGTSYELGTGSWVCVNGKWLVCNQDNACNKADFDLDGKGELYCNSSSWVEASLAYDVCKNACEDYGGVWSRNVSFELNAYAYDCCIAKQAETFCGGDLELAVKCENGVATRCSEWCDVYGTVSDGDEIYTCTGERDRDCTTRGCISGACNCKKSDGIACNTDEACFSGVCRAFEALDFSASITGKVCCGNGGCAYDSNRDGIVDACAENNSLLDADGDGDIDYCLNGVWQECESYTCSSGENCSCIAGGACFFTDAEPGVYPPTSLTGTCAFSMPALTCGTPCDIDGNLTTREYVNTEGRCVAGGGSCQDILLDYSWSGTTQNFELNLVVDCLCSNTAEAKLILVYPDSTYVVVNSTEVPANGESSVIKASLPVKSGLNELWLNLSCKNAVPQGCSYKIGEIKSGVALSAEIPEAVYSNITFAIPVKISNFGEVSLEGELNITFNNLKDSKSFIYPVVVEAGSEYSFVATGTIPCYLLLPTNETLVNYTLLNVSVVFRAGETEAEVKGSTRAYQCKYASNCLACFGPGDFVCSYGVCCAQGEHFENGACCALGLTCCVLDEQCGNNYYCDNSTHSCQAKKGIGASCTRNEECITNWCGGGICTYKQPPSLVEYSECSPVSDFCDFESISINGELGVKGCVGDSDCASNYFCLETRAQCIACPEPGDKASRDLVCPSPACTGLDQDCCISDSNCTYAPNLYCDKTSNTCVACKEYRDYYCPSSTCLGIDPDCCASDDDCLDPGTTCKNGVCIGNIGASCESDADCTGGLVCRAYRCTLPSFIFIEPVEEEPVKMKVGEVRSYSLIILDPQLETDSYKVEVFGRVPTVIATFEDGTTSKRVVVKKGSREVLKLKVFAGWVGNAEFGVHIESTTRAAIEDEKWVSVSIESTSKHPLTRTAPWFSAAAALIAAIAVMLRW